MKNQQLASTEEKSLKKVKNNLNTLTQLPNPKHHSWMKTQE
jgi:hypothetical protein